MFIRSVPMARINHGKNMLILVVCCLVLIDGAAGGRRALTNLKITRQLKHLNKPAVKSIKSENGDIIDCVDIYKQPAFDHPLLKNHTIQMRPSYYDNEKKKSSSKVIEQQWRKSGSCAQETIPILRTQKSDLLRTASMKGYKMNATTASAESAKLYVEEENHGGQANINVWNIHVEHGEWSSASIFVAAKGKPDLINSGWMVSESIFRDNKTRFYVFWASDIGGCYNLMCPGFIQTNPNVVLGDVLSPVSTYGGDQHEIHVKIQKDRNDHWWFEIEYEPVGYWPGSLFKNMATSADLIQWGGQLWNTAPGGRHTSTQMGSGHFTKEGLKKAAYIDNCIFFNQKNQERTPSQYSPKATKPYCYDISREIKERGPLGLGFFYGGPGGPGCDKWNSNH